MNNGRDQTRPLGAQPGVPLFPLLWGSWGEVVGKPGPPWREWGRHPPPSAGQVPTL